MLQGEDAYKFINDAKNNCIVLGGKCNKSCIFCSCLTQSKVGLKNWTDPIDKTDLQYAIDFIDNSMPIYFGEGVSFLSCEPFLHPKFLELFEEINNHFPQTVKRITTIGTDITRAHIDVLLKQNVEIFVSVNTLDKQWRSKLMKNDNYNNLIYILDVLEEKIKQINLFYLGDLDVLKKDLDRLYNINNNLLQKQILLRLIEYSKYSPSMVKKIHINSKKSWHAAIEYFDKNVSYPLYWIRELYNFPQTKMTKVSYGKFNIHTARNDFNIRIKKALSFVEDNLLDSAILLAESSYEYFINKYPEYKDIAIKVENKTFGGSYIATPLLTKNDILNAIITHKKYEYYIASSDIFSYNLRDLTRNKAIVDYPINLILVE